MVTRAVVAAQTSRYKLREGNLFTRVCQSVYEGGVTLTPGPGSTPTGIIPPGTIPLRTIITPLEPQKRGEGGRNAGMLSC